MTRNPIRKALLERIPAFGGWIQCGNAATAEIFARAGFDWLAADGEHSELDVALYSAIFRGMHGRGPVPFIRVRENDTLAIRQALDAGAMGVIVPLISTADQARLAVQAAKYPPSGVRGFGYCRANNWGADFDPYAANANDDIAVVVMIESREGASNINEILAVDGVDGVFIGPYDLSGSYGIPGQITDPAVTNACARVADACRAAGKSAGMHIVRPTPESIQNALDGGFTFLALGLDSVFLAEGARAALLSAREPDK